ncbi:carbohydrate-binding domain-containing protein [Ruminococcus albus]|uniref:carbohydrate-binding domain-containing protein n=1 Tax=Ruminococcus albus TaxID=1264 RepID=UPI001FA91E3C|nr:carbohydrate-binding domain-containing protein [Ruminococcus albus]
MRISHKPIPIPQFALDIPLSFYYPLIFGAYNLVTGTKTDKSTNAYETAIEINGGYINVAVGQGDTDAIDSNGSIYVNGGTINVTAQMSSFDYDRTSEFNDGTIIINGTEVSEIPQNMMGGGMHGVKDGFGGGGGRRF